MFQPILRGLLKQRASKGDLNFQRMFFLYHLDGEWALLTYPAQKIKKVDLKSCELVQQKDQTPKICMLVK